MKNFEYEIGAIFAQGDMIVECVSELPIGTTKVDAERGNFILAHSETGHDHVVKYQPEVEMYRTSNDNFTAYLIIKNDAKCLVEHKRSFDTHETVALLKPAGDDIKDNVTRIYRIRRQREATPEGWQRAQD